MPNRYHVAQARVALVTALSMLVPPGVPSIGAQTKTPPAASPAPAKAASPAPKAATPATASPAPVERGWPRGYETPTGGRIVLYQPQVVSWDDQKRMVALAGVSFLAKGAQKAALGTIKLEADTKVSVGERLVNFAPINISE